MYNSWSEIVTKRTWEQIWAGKISKLEYRQTKIMQPAEKKEKEIKNKQRLKDL